MISSVLLPSSSTRKSRGLLLYYPSTPGRNLNTPREDCFFVSKNETTKPIERSIQKKAKL